MLKNTAAAMKDDSDNAANVVETPAPAPARDAVTHIANKRNNQTLANLAVSCSGELPVLKNVAKKLRKSSPRLTKNGPTQMMKVL